jgi:hypothetical protein
MDIFMYFALPPPEAELAILIFCSLKQNITNKLHILKIGNTPTCFGYYLQSSSVVSIVKDVYSVVNIALSYVDDTNMVSPDY